MSCNFMYISDLGTYPGSFPRLVCPPSHQAQDKIYNEALLQLQLIFLPRTSHHVADPTQGYATVAQKT